MSNSEERLGTIEAQSSRSETNDQRRRRYSPLNLITNIISSFGPGGILQRGGEDTPSREMGSVPEFPNFLLSQFFEIRGDPVPMTPEIFSLVSAGSEVYTNMPCLESKNGDSILHLAAAWGHLDLVKNIVTQSPSLFLQPNFKNQLPIHVAADAGCLAVVEAFVAMVTSFSSSDDERLNTYVMKDIDGHTPLHLALKSYHKETAACLVRANKRASFLANKDGISPLYLAVETGDESLVRAMLNNTGNDTLISQLEGRKFLVHMALKARITGIVDLILQRDPSFEEIRDDDGKTCLSFGASIGFYEGVCNLLTRSPKSVYVCDEDGSFPIHIAVEKCHTNVVKEILKLFPASRNLLNKNGQNILHVAANRGKATPFLLNYLDKFGWKNQLILQQDVNGNTPLHVATIKWRPSTLVSLLRNRASRQICMRTQNNTGLTALDIAESNLQPNYIFMERMTLVVLLYYYALSSSSWMMFKKKITKPSCPPCDNNKDYIKALLLVAALVATVTFAACFTIPGGFNSSGTATLSSKSTLHDFVILNTLAMQSSILAIATLIWAQFGDPALIQRSLNVALPLLFFALLCMPLAFYCGVVIAFIDVPLLTVFFGITFGGFVALMVIVLGPHVVLQISGIPAIFGIYFVMYASVVDNDVYVQDRVIKEEFPTLPIRTCEIEATNSITTSQVDPQSWSLGQVTRVRAKSLSDLRIYSSQERLTKSV